MILKVAKGESVDIKDSGSSGSDDTQNGNSSVKKVQFVDQP